MYICIYIFLHIQNNGKSVEGSGKKVESLEGEHGISMAKTAISPRSQRKRSENEKSETDMSKINEKNENEKKVKNENTEDKNENKKIKR
jgi:hypothetical protein